MLPLVGSHEGRQRHEGGIRIKSADVPDSSASPSKSEQSLHHTGRFR